MGISTKRGTLMSGDATVTTAGAVTIADNAVDGTDIALTSEAAGDIMYADGTDWVPLAKGTAGQGLLVNAGATAPEWASMSGDATQAAGGAVTLAKKNIRVSATDFSAALVIASNATPLVMLDHSALVTAGTVAAGDVLMFHGAVLQMHGGAANYDQNQNFIAKYQTAGGGATVSTTLANWANGAADGALTTVKPIATDIVPEADQDIVMTSSASPKNAAGDRLLYIWTFYSVFTPTT